VVEVNDEEEELISSLCELRFLLILTIVEGLVLELVVELNDLAGDLSRLLFDDDCDGVVGVVME